MFSCLFLHGAMEGLAALFLLLLVLGLASFVFNIVYVVQALRGHVGKFTKICSILLSGLALVPGLIFLKNGLEDSSLLPFGFVCLVPLMLTVSAMALENRKIQQ